MSRLKTIAIVAALTILIALWSSVFILNQTQQALVLQFGELQRVITEPGLHFRIPFIQDVTFYEKRILDFDMKKATIIMGSQERMDVDTYTRYRISNALKFYKTVKPADENGIDIQLQTIVGSALRNVLSRTNLSDLLSGERVKVMHQIKAEVEKMTKPLGLEIIDVRIKRTELQPANRKAAFDRMNSEQERIAKQNRAQGAEKAQEIRSTAEKDRTVILAEAQRDAQKNRGEGEAKALTLVSETLGRDPEFYGFYRSMEIYKATLGEGKTMMLSTDNELFKYFSHPEHLTK